MRNINMTRIEMLPVVTFCYNYKNCIKVCNLGDYIQTIALENFYRRFFPDEEQIVLDRDDLARYKGKKALVLMQGWFSTAGNLDFLPGQDLVPVFAGVHFSLPLRKNLLRMQGNFPPLLRNVEIGCRDYSTMLFLQSIGIKTYLSRCLTLTFPKRTEKTPEQNKIFWVDLPEHLEKFLPPVFHENYERICQQKIPFEHGKETENKMRAVALLERYRREARCVVTAAIHCAMPCAAMGIPVLFINYNYRDSNAVIERWSAMHGIIPVYSEADLLQNRVSNSIPDIPEFEDLKENILQNAYLSCLGAVGETDREKLRQARDFIARYNKIGAPAYDLLRTIDDIDTLDELNQTRKAVYRLENSLSFRIGQMLTWLPRKFTGLFHNLKENGFRYTITLFFRKLGMHR